MQEPTEVMTLAGVMEDVGRRGFTDQFTLVNGQLRAVTSRTSFTADQVTVREYYRFEGVSDPDDMAILYAIEASNGVRGTLTDAFGVYSDPRVGAFMTHVAMDRGARRDPA